MLNKITKKYLVFIFILFFCTKTVVANRYICEDKKEPLPHDLKQLVYRISSFVYGSEDLKTIDKYVSEAIKNPSDNILKNHVNYIGALRKTIESIQLPQKQLLLLLDFSKNMKKQAGIDNLLDDITWWSQARIIIDKEEFNKFIENQMWTKRKGDVVKLLIEKGMVDEIKFWSKKIKLKDNSTHSTNKSEIFFNYALRKANIINALNHNEINSVIIPEITKSIDDILFLNKEADVFLNYSHLNWLILQLGLYQKNSRVQEILQNLSKDRFFYNTKKLKKLKPIERKLTLEYGLIHKFKGINSIIFNVNRALAPFKELAVPTSYNVCFDLEKEIMQNQ